MKNSLLLTLFFIIGCYSKENVQKKNSQFEKLIQQSDSNINKINETNKILDSVSTIVVISTQKKLDSLIVSVDSIKSESDNYKNKFLNSRQVTKERIIYHTDTVFIETKKNFWGKQKTKINVTSDSLIQENHSDTTY